MSNTQIQAVNEWHEAMVDFEIKHPAATLAEIALFFDKSIPWISIVRNSDAYREYRAGRIGEHQTRVSATTVEKLEALADVTVDEMLTKVEAERERLSINDLGSCASLALKALGYGGSRGGAPVNATQHNHFYGTPGPGTLERARENYKRVHDENSQQLLPAPGEVPQAS